GTRVRHVRRRQAVLRHLLRADRRRGRDRADPRRTTGAITLAVQALAGVLLPIASVFLLLLCNDPEVLGPWANRRWLNILAGVIIGVLLTLSGTLVTTT